MRLRAPLPGQNKRKKHLKSLKKHLSSTPILAFPDVKQPFILYTDASLTAMGAILAPMQYGKERAICYASKAFSKSQSNYSATKRELLAIVTFTRYFKHSLLGTKLKIVTDHRALQWLHNFKDPDGLTARWLERLAAIDYGAQHKPGKSRRTFTNTNCKSSYYFPKQRKTR